MKLAAKITLAVVLGICAVMAYYQLTDIEEEIGKYQADMQSDLLITGRLFRPTLEHAWRTGGEPAAEGMLASARQTLRQSGRTDRMEIRLVSLAADAPPGRAPRVERAQLGPALRGQELPVVTRAPGGERRLYSYVPLNVGAGPVIALELSESLDSLDQWGQSLRRRAWETTLYLVTACTALTIVVGMLLIARPTRKLTAAVGRIGEGDLDVRVDVRQSDELGKLAKGINDMCVQLAASSERATAEHNKCVHILEQLRHVDRMAVMGKLTSGLAHQMGTPLAVVAGRASMISEGIVEGEEAVRCAQNIERQVEKMTAILQQMIDFSRQRKVTLEPCDLRTLAEETVTMLRPIAQGRQIDLVLHADQTATLRANIDSAQIQQVLSNLIVNAMDAMPEGGLITVGVERRGSDVCCYIEDQGKGIPSQIRSRIFEPFFTTKSPGTGTGLGLPVSQGIIGEHGGRLEVDSEVGRGARFSVYLPAVADTKDSGTSTAEYFSESNTGRNTP